MLKASANESSVVQTDMKKTGNIRERMTRGMRQYCEFISMGMS